MYEAACGAPFLHKTNDSVPSLGFVFTEIDPYLGIDYDECLEANELDPQVIDETGPSDDRRPRSARRVGRGVTLGNRSEGHRKGQEARREMPYRGSALGGQIEFYGRDRFFTITREILEGHEYVVTNGQEALEKIYQRSFQPASDAPTDTLPPRYSGGAFQRRGATQEGPQLPPRRGLPEAIRSR